MNKIFIGALSIGILIISVSLAYHYAVYLPKFQQEKIDIERDKLRKDNDRDLALNKCLNDANEFGSFCTKNPPPGADLAQLADYWHGCDKSMEQQKNECFKRYK